MTPPSSSSPHQPVGEVPDVGDVGDVRDDRQSGNGDMRALVLAGAGAAGNAWELGLVAGLAEAGVDVTDAELVIGTSAGSTVAAQLTSGTPPADLYAAILAEVPPSPAGGAGPGAGRPPRVSGPDYLDWSNKIIAAAEDAADMRRRMGAAALELDASGGSGGSGGTRWRDIVASRLPSPHWPQQRVLLTAVNAHTGEPVVFDRHSGVDLVDAVAASTSAMTPYPIGAHRYINGGYRRSENADLAAGYGRVPDPVPLQRPHADAAGVGHGPGHPGRRAARRRQQGRDRLPRRTIGRRVRSERAGSVDATAGRPRRLRPGPSPRGCAQGFLALTPTCLGTVVSAVEWIPNDLLMALT